MGRNYYLYIAIFFTIAITLGSLLSLKGIEQPKVHFFDKFVHVGGYFVLNLSWLLAFQTKIKTLKPAILISCLVFVYGIVIEVLQAVLTNYRQADFYDMLANLLGISIALFIFMLVFKKTEMN